MVTCSVCGNRLSCAPENHGSFPAETFEITDTCEGCAERLKKAVSHEAQAIRDRLQARRTTP